MVYTPLSPPAAFSPISSSSWGAIVAANLTDHETRISANTADLTARGRVNSGDSTTGPTNVTTTETAFHSLVATMVGGRSYRYVWDGTIVGNGVSGSPYFEFRVRYIAGSVFTVAGSTVVRTKPTALLGGGNWDGRTMVGEIFAPYTGTFTIAMTVVRTAGTGGMDIRGGAHYYVDCVK